MANLSLSFLGSFRARLDDEKIKFRTRKAQAMLIYLATEAAVGRDPAQRREKLLALLWQDYPERSARQSLRTNLSYLKKSIPDLHSWGGHGRQPFLLSDNQAVQINSAVSYDLDVATFTRLLHDTETHRHVDLPACGQCRERLEKAVALYRDNFLVDFYLPDSSQFEGWAASRREALRRQALAAMGTLTEMHLAQMEFDQAERIARRQLEIDELRESAHRQLMNLLARTGRRRAALRHYETFRQLLFDELEIEPSTETVALHETITNETVTAGDLNGAAAAGQREDVFSTPSSPRLASAPTLGPQSETTYRLPPQPTPFIGRQEELAALDRLVTDPDVRLVTIVGHGGLGKTRLLIEAAAAQLNNFVHGVVLVELAPVNPADFVGVIEPLVATIADALDLPLQRSSDPKEQLVNYLREKEMLLLLDNFEHLLDSAVVVAHILRDAPQLKTVITSRERLNLREEWQYSLEGLSFPLIVESSDVSTTDYSAIQLFQQRALQVRSTFNLAAEYPAVVRICQLVEGLPLGIELAAAWTRMMSCQEIAQEIELGIDILATNLRDLPERQRSLRAIFDHSWVHLTGEEQAVFAKLSVFRGGFRRDAAGIVAGASLHDLSSLVDQSLVRVTPGGRYELHQLLRQFAAGKLGQTPGDEEQTQADHGQFYLQFLRKQEPHLKGARMQEAMAEISTDIDNVRAAWRWSVALDWGEEFPGVLEPLWLFYEVRGWFLEAEDAFGRVVGMLRPKCAMKLEPSESSDVVGVCFLLGRALTYLGWFQGRLGHAGQAEATIQESLSLLRLAGGSAQREIALSLTFLGEIMFTGGVPLIEEGALIFKEAVDPWGHAFALILLSQLAGVEGAYSEAERLARESAAIYDSLGEQYWVLYNLNTLGRMAQARGLYAEAEVHFQECLARRRQSGDRTGTAFTLKDLGEVARLRENMVLAEHHYQQSLAIADEIGLPLAIAQALRGLGSLAQGVGDYVIAKEHYKKGLDTLRTIRLTDHTGDFSGWASLGLGEWIEAERGFLDLLRVTISTRQFPIALDALAGLAAVQGETGQLERALELLALILDHPATNQETKDRVTQLQSGLASTLPADEVEEALERGRGLDLERVAIEMLDQPDNPQA
jgi:predicted ATPase/DNA-binding SARP family transcriptional activator